MVWLRSRWCRLMLPFFPALITRAPATSFPWDWKAEISSPTFSKQHTETSLSRRESLSRELGVHARALETIAVQVEKDSGWTYMGLDATPAPNGDSSIGAAIEKLTGAKFGSSGTLTAAAVITSAVRSIPVKRVGYSGLMLPPLEDPVLAQRWSEGTYDLDSLLAYSAVCGTGLDTVPLPGDVSQRPTGADHRRRGQPGCEMAQASYREADSGPWEKSWRRYRFWFWSSESADHEAAAVALGVRMAKMSGKTGGRKSKAACSSGGPCWRRFRANAQSFYPGIAVTVPKDVWSLRSC